MFGVLLLLLIILVSTSPSIGTDDVETVDFAHETCQLETLSSNIFQTFYPTKTFSDENGVLELHMRFKGIADGHIGLTTNATDSSSHYYILLGSFNNKVSEIRKKYEFRIPSRPKVEFKINTPGILSDRQYRGFIIRYNQNSGELWVFAEGNDVPLLHLVDPEPLTIQYFSFATWVGRVVQVAFDCRPKDTYSDFIQIRNTSKY